MLASMVKLRDQKSGQSGEVHDIRKMAEAYFSSPVLKSFLAGSFSGTCSTLLLQPLDLVKTRLQSRILVPGSGPTGILTVVGHVVRKEKLLGLWKGVAPSLTRTVPGIGMYFCSLQWIKNHVGTNDTSPLGSMLMGASARCVAGVSMLPFTVIKTRYESGQFGYKSVGQAFVAIYKGEGVRGLFSGLSATLLRDAPFSGIYLMFYNETKKYAKKYLDTENPRPIVLFCCGIIAGGLSSVATQPCDVVKTHMQLCPGRFRTIRKAAVFVYQNEGSKGFFRGIVPRTIRRTLMSALAWTVYEKVMEKIHLTR